MLKKIAVILGIILTSGLCADANSLTRLDVQKSGSDTVDLTFFTNETPYDNAVVRKKSDTDYVILIPKLTSENYHASGISSSLKDLIADINVRNIEDSSGGYTKVTITSKKPINIRANTKKAEGTAEEKEYSGLIAQLNNIKDKIPADTVVKTTPAQPAAIPVTVLKPSEIKRKETGKTVAKASVVEVPSSPPVIADPIEKVEELPEIPPEFKSSIDEIKGNEKKSDPAKKSRDLLPLSAESNPAKRTLVILAAFIFSLFALAKFMKTALNSSEQRISLKYLDRRPHYDYSYEAQDMPPAEEAPRTDLYNYKPENSVSSASGNPFGKFPDKSSDKSDMPQTLPVPSSFAEISNIPDIYEDEEDIEDIIAQSLTAENLNRNISFKGYTNNPLAAAKRSKMHSEHARKRKKNLEELNENRKRLNEEIKIHNEFMSTDTAEEFQAAPAVQLYAAPMPAAQIPDVQPAQTPSGRITNPLISDLNKINRRQMQSASLNVVPPNLIVKASYKINENKGLYLVSHNGTDALIGKINDEVFVLKKFDAPLRDEQIQVRKDKENIYMVKTKGFKSLIEVGSNKMGVLVEL